MRGTRAQVQITHGHEPVPVVDPLIVDGRRDDPAFQPLGPTALFEDAGRVAHVVTEQSARLAVVDDAADDAAARGIGVRVKIAYLIEGGEDLVAGSETDGGRGARGLG